MVKIYYYKISKKITDVSQEELLSFLSKEEIKRALAYKFEKDYNLYVAGKLMTRKVIASFFDTTPQKIKFRIDKMGRPFLDYPKVDNFDFNISHSGEYVVMAVSNTRVGIDIERIKPIDLTISKDVFHEKELDFLYAATNEADCFFRIWTLKEAFIKAIGEGLSYPLKQFYFNFEKGKIKINILEEANNDEWFFKEFPLDADYKLAICLQRNEQVDKPILFVDIY